MKRFLAILLIGIAIPSSRADGPRVDLNPDNGRGDVKTPGWNNWAVPAKSEATMRFGDLSITLRTAEAGQNLDTPWWKAGFDFPARMASDGVSANRELRIVISGLSPGRQSLATFHNAVTGEAIKPIRVTGPGGVTATVTPSRQVRHDDEAAAAYLTFEAVADTPVEFRLQSDGPVILNGFEINRTDPTMRVCKPNPPDRDEHTIESPVLSWQTKTSAIRYRVYFGISPGKLSLVGETAEPTFPTQALKLNHLTTSYWRVDTVLPNETVRGETWSFRIRHLAFPEAEGYGRFAIGGRGGRVLEVTNLNDSGPGSLREAVEAEGPRTVIFRVGGVIELKSKLIVRHPYLTVAGQTAPGDGICVTNYTFGCSDTHDVIIRHVRIRIGDATGTTQDGSGARGSDHVIFDHCSISWSIDEGFSSRQGGNLTVQRCLIAEALNVANHKKYQPGKGHSFAGSISGDIGSFHHNLLAHCTGRNWSLAGGLDRGGQRLAGRLDLRNNVVYNWRDRTTDGGVLALNFVNNYYLPGPATKTFTLLKPDPGDADRGMTAYMAGNVIEGKVEGNDWTAFVGPADALTKVSRNEPLFESFVNTHSARDAYASVIADVGATKPKQDAVDRRIINDVRNRTHTYSGSRGKLPGIIDSPTDAGGLPRYESGTPPADRDRDGMPDDWEKSHGLDPANPTDGSTASLDGYTNLEWYLNQLASGRPSDDLKYRQTIRKRSEGAVATAKITNPSNAEAAMRAVESHYAGIFDIHADRDAAIKAGASGVEAIRAKALDQVRVVDAAFTRSLQELMSAEQADAIKDAMTFNVRTNTYRVYCEMLPKLTDEEKSVLQAHLRRGRDEALIAGDANEKHEKFRLAKGRIGNYLSSRGYDVKKAQDEWSARQKQAKPAGQKP